MFIVKATPPSGITFLVLCYPGILMGNGPAINEYGVLQTTNYIAGLKYDNGIPRYVLGRAVLEAEGLEQAIEIATHPRRAFSYHHNLGSFAEKQLISLEVTPFDHIKHIPDTNYFHTNHFILGDNVHFPQDSAYVHSSSLSRYFVIGKLMNEYKNHNQITNENVIDIISSHKKAPFSPCRHPMGDVHGISLGTAWFDLNNGIMRIYKGNPCESFPEKRYQEFNYNNL